MKAFPLGCTLVDVQGLLWLPYDLEHLKYVPQGLAPVGSNVHVFGANRVPFTVNYARRSHVHVLNGMGVALGDSIVGLTALHWLKENFPALTLHLYRASHSPDYVEHIYKLAQPWLGSISRLPLHEGQLPHKDLIIDLGDIVHWPQFDKLPLVDFFFWALGIDPKAVPDAAKTNGWLAKNSLSKSACSLDKLAGEPFVLFSPFASTPLRSIPRHMLPAYVDRIYRHYGRRVFGHAEIAHPQYVCIKAAMTDTGSFLQCIAQADAVITVDSAAVHAAAGFERPCLGIFNTISPALRASYYPFCRTLDISSDAVRGLHSTSDADLLRVSDRHWETLLTKDWDWPS